MFEDDQVVGLSVSGIGGLVGCGACGVEMRLRRRLRARQRAIRAPAARPAIPADRSVVEVSPSLAGGGGVAAV